MKMLFHLLRADVRRFWPGIAMWVAVVVIRALATEAPRETVDAGGLLAVLPSLLNWLVMLLFAVLVVQIVQAHPAVGTTAFWMTRPLPPLAMAAAKVVLLAAVFAAVPAATGAARMLRYAMPLSDIGIVAAQTLYLYGTALAIVMAVAVMTSSLPRAAVLGAALMLAAAAVGLVVRALWTRESIAIGEVTAVLVSASHTPLNYALPPPDLLPGILLLAGGLAVVLIQYVRRSRPLSAAAGLTAAILAVVSGAVQPFPVRTGAVPPPVWTGEANGVALSVAPGGVEFTTGDEWGGLEGGRRAITKAVAALRVENARAGWLTSVALASASLTFPDGTRVDSRRGDGTTFIAWGDEGERAMEEAVRDTLDAAWMPPDRLYVRRKVVSLFVIPEEQAAPLAGRRAAYEGTFNVFFTRLGVAGTMPVGPGSAFQEGGFKLQIENVTLDDAVLKIRARSASVATMFDRTPRPFYDIYLRHPASGAALRPSNVARDWGRFNTLWGMHVFLASQGFETETLTIWFDRRSADGRPALATSDAWQQQSELVLLRSQYAGHVTRALHIPDLTVNLPTK